MQLTAFTWGAAAVVGVWLVVGILTGTWVPGRLIEGADKRVSTSKFQWWLWTAVGFFTYGALYAARAIFHQFDALSAPPNFLYAMGFSSVTMVGAKAITSGYSASGQVIKVPGTDPNVPPIHGLQGIILDDDGIPDLSKIQMVGWTLIAAVSYVIRVWFAIPVMIAAPSMQPPPQMPDIDPGLMVLMGLGQGAYLGKKLVTTDVARLTGLSVGSGRPGTQIVMTGTSFGTTQNGSLITFDGNPVELAPPIWGDTQITLTLPPQAPNGQNWLPNQRIQIGIIVGGRESANTLPFSANP